MSRAHAVEVVLTRPATAEERDALDDRWTDRYAFSSDLRRATAVITARSATDALDEAWNQVSASLLPVDVIWTVYPDSDGFVGLTVSLDDAVELMLRRRADRAGLPPGEFVAQALREALERDAARRADRIRAEVQRILVWSSPAEVLAVLLAAPTKPPRGADR